MKTGLWVGVLQSRYGDNLGVESRRGICKSLWWKEIWSDRCGGECSVRDAYKKLTRTFSWEIGNTGSSKNLEPYNSFENFCFGRRIMQNKLPTKNNLIRRNVLSLDKAHCALDCGKSENINHLFFRLSTGCKLVGRDLELDRNCFKFHSQRICLL